MSFQSHTARALPGVRIRSKAKAKARGVVFSSRQQLLTSLAATQESHALALLQEACSAPWQQGGQAQLWSLDSTTVPCPFLWFPGMGLSAGYELFYIPAAG